MDPNTLEIQVEDPAGPDAQRLIQAFAQELGERYGDDGPVVFSPEDLKGHGRAFLVARLKGEAVGCFAIGPFGPQEPKVSEAKGLFLMPAMRGQGLSRTLLRHLEEKAASMGYTTVRLVTGLRESEAIHLFVKGGYSRIPRFGPYAQRPLSVCFEKRL